VVAALVNESVDGSTDTSSTVMTMAVFGLLFFGLPMFFVTLLIALIWVGTLRWVMQALARAHTRDSGILWPGGTPGDSDVSQRP
jgi:hypothetical protein